MIPKETTQQLLKNIDLVIVLGKQLSREGLMPTDLINRLDAVIALVRDKPNSNILVSGKYSDAYDKEGFTPTHYECDVMYDYLVSKGVPPSNISKECESKDTISNVTYIKKYLDIHTSYKNLLVVCANHHQPRVKFLFDTYVGDSRTINYLTLNANPTQQEILIEKEMLHRLQNSTSE